MKKIDKKVFWIFFIIILGCIAMAVTDAVVKPNYFIKSLIKIIFFLAIPLIYFWRSKDSYLKKIMLPNKKGFLKSLLLGVAIYVVIIITYFLARNFYDFSTITNLLTSNVGVSGANFVFVSIYISFCNSLLEEFFFRGFAFLTLSKFISKKWTFIFSSVAFAIYHVAIMIGWFSPALFILALIGLFVGGCIFNFLDSKNENIYNSYMTHMFANFAINTIGFILFGIVG